MTPVGYALLAYGVGLGLLAGYGIGLWARSRRGRRRG